MILRKYKFRELIFRMNFLSRKCFIDSGFVWNIVWRQKLHSGISVAEKMQKNIVMLRASLGAACNKKNSQNLY